MSPMQKRNTWLLLLVVPAVVGISLLVQLAAPVAGWQYWLVRSLALSGYLLVFLAAVSSTSLPGLAKAFGRPFVAVHHVATIAGFTAMLAHPSPTRFRSGRWRSSSPADSLEEFFRWGGRPALVLFIVAVVAALLRLAFKKGWRYFHLAVYLAFLLATVHANLIGSSFLGASPCGRLVGHGGGRDRRLRAPPAPAAERRPPGAGDIEAARCEGEAMSPQSQLKPLMEGYFLDYASYVIMDRAIPACGTGASPCSAASSTRCTRCTTASSTRSPTSSARR